MAAEVGDGAALREGAESPIRRLLAAQAEHVAATTEPLARHAAAFGYAASLVQLSAALRIAARLREGLAPGSRVARLLEALTTPSTTVWAVLLAELALPEERLAEAPPPEVVTFTAALRQTACLSAETITRGRERGLLGFCELLGAYDWVVQEEGGRPELTEALAAASLAAATDPRLLDPAIRVRATGSQLLLEGGGSLAPALAISVAGELGWLDCAFVDASREREGTVVQVASLRYEARPGRRVLVDLDAREAVAAHLARLAARSDDAVSKRLARAATEVELVGATPAPALRQLGATIGGRYRLASLLGSGAMGVVYAAEHMELSRPVAIKLLKPELAAHPGAVERFRREAQEAAGTRHPGIVDVLDFGRDEASGALFLVMERLEGQPLDALLRNEGPLPIEQAVALAVEALDALEAAHARGVVHRDLKPQNLFVCHDGRLKILDFGIAKLTEGASAITSTGAVMGTPAYMSLEQMRSAASVDRRSDVYAMGVTLYELLTGRLPLYGASIVELITAVVEDRVQRSPRHHRPEIPWWLDRLVQRALAKEPADRYATAAAMRDALLAGPDEARVAAVLEAPEEVALPVVDEDLRPAPPEGSAASSARARSPDESRSPPARRGAWLAAALLVALTMLLGAWNGGLFDEALEPLGHLVVPEVEPPPLPSATPFEYRLDGITAVAPDCPVARLVVATAPAPPPPTWTFAREVLLAEPDFEVTTGEQVVGDALAFVERHFDRGVALVATCRGAVCNQFAAAYKTLVPTARPELFCGAMPASLAGTSVPVAMRSPGGFVPPDKQDARRICARLGVCQRWADPARAGDPALDCQKNPFGHPLHCASESSCAAVVACIEEAPP
ncbi:MAG: protein kinase [Polyangiaceae bacterium]